MENNNQNRKRKKLGDMNLLDNFLFTQIITSPQYGRWFARYLVKTLVQKDPSGFSVIPQKVYNGADSNLRGARMDVIIEEGESSKDGQAEIFDIEPDQNSQKEALSSLPRRTRFYHIFLYRWITDHPGNW